MPQTVDTAEGVIVDHFHGKIPLSFIVSASGWTSKGATEAKAVALAESAGDPKIDNGSCCVGLWQIHRMHAGIVGSPTDPAKFTEWLKDPFNNGKAAYEIWKQAGGTFAKDWQTYQNGAYRNYLGRDKLIDVTKPEVGGLGGVINTVTGAPLNVAEGALNAATAVPKLIGALFDPSTWLRLGKGALGGTLLVIGTGALVFVVANKASGGAVGKAAKDAALA